MAAALLAFMLAGILALLALMALGILVGFRPGTARPLPCSAHANPEIAGKQGNTSLKLAM